MNNPPVRPWNDNSRLGNLSWKSRGAHAAHISDATFGSFASPKLPNCGDFSDFSGAQRGQRPPPHSTTLFRRQRSRSTYSRYTTCSNATQTTGGPSEGRCSTPAASQSFPVLSCAFLLRGQDQDRNLASSHARYEVSFHVHLRFIFVLNSLRHRSLQYPQGSTLAA